VRFLLAINEAQITNAQNVNDESYELALGQIGKPTSLNPFNKRTEHNVINS